MARSASQFEMQYQIPEALQPAFDKLEQEGFFKAVNSKCNSKVVLVSLDEEVLESESISNWLNLYIDHHLDIRHPDVGCQIDGLLDAVSKGKVLDLELA
ncbi:MAG: hypothetical protein CFH44_00277 [Proteobacteria bacterium]|nr:MAG: hypothetical protein CFH44_00277 [Pseudomonadota bacterium]